jgi:biotin carboxylase
VERRILVLGAGPAQLGLLRAARERGLFVIACDRDPGAPGFVYADRRALVSTEDEEGLDRLMRAEPVDGIISPGSDWPVSVAARLAARQGLPHPLEPETAAIAVSKVRQRERFAELGVPQPAFVMASDTASAREGAARLGYPCVVKAPDRQGQRGLTLVESPDELPDAVEAALASSRSRVCMVEALAPGQEVTVNAFSIDGSFHALTVTDRMTAAPPAFGVALAHVFPALDAGDAIDAAEAAAAAVGVRNGPTYTQVLVGPGGAHVMELAARLGGGHDAELCQAAVGVDLNGLALGAALGEPVEPPEPRPQGGACVVFLVPPEGTLERVEGLEEATKLDGVLEARVYRRPGWEFGPFRRGADRAGFVLAAGGSREEALARARRAAASVQFVTVDAQAVV